MFKTIFADFVDKYFRPLVAAITEKFNGKAEEDPLLYKTILTEEYTPDLKWDSAALNHAIVAADVVSLDSSLPLKRRSVMAVANGEVAKLGMKFRKGESDITKINIMIARGAEESTIAGKIFDDATKAIKGIEVRTEIMTEQGLSSGMALVGEDDNTGTGVRVSYGYLPANTVHATTAKWGEDGATPIDDIRAMFDRAEAHGNAISHVWISKKYFNLARKSDQGKLLAASFRSQVITDKSLLPMPGQTLFTEALEDEFGATFHIVNSTFVYETPDGKRHSVKPWVQANVIGTPTDKVGRLVYGTLAEETNPVEGVSYAKSGSYILVSKFSKSDPLEEFTASQALLLPVIDGADGIYILHADAVETSDLSVDPASLTFTAKASTKTAEIHYDGAVSDLTAETDADWLTVKILSTKKVSVTVKANAASSDDEGNATAATERTATVTVKAGDSTATIAVTQAA